MKTSKIMSLVLSLAMLSAVAANAAPAKKSSKTSPVTITVIEMTGNANGSEDESLSEGLKQFIGGDVKIVKVDREAALNDPKYKGLDLDYMPLYLVDKNKVTEEKFAEPIKYGQLPVQGDFIVFAKQTRHGIYANKAATPNLLEIFVMSQCPYGVLAENKIIDGMKLNKLPKNVKVDIRYIVSAGSKEGEFNSLHGAGEWEENVRQLIIKKRYPNKFWKYLEIRNKNYQSSLWDEAAEEAGINPKVFKKYWKEGLEMLKEEIKHASEYNVGSSPTVIWEGRIVTDMGSLGTLPGFEAFGETFGSGSGNGGAAAPAGSC